MAFPSSEKIPSTPVLVSKYIEPQIGREIGSEGLVEIPFGRNWQLEDPHPSRILDRRSDATDRLGELYARMLEEDGELQGLVDKRLDAVMALPRIIEAADDTPLALKTALFCSQVCSIIPSFPKFLRHQASSLATGVAFDELTWDHKEVPGFGESLIPVRIVDRPMWRFGFVKGVLHVRRPGTATLLEPAPPGQFIVMRQGTLDSPWGAGLLDAAWKYWFIKKHGVKWFAVHVEKWASPTTVAKYQHNNATPEGEKATAELMGQALRLAQAIQSNLAVAMPEGVDASLLEATRSGEGGYSTLANLCSRAHALLFLGEVNTSGMRPGVGAFASDQVANEVRFEKVSLTADDLGPHVREQLFRPLVELNFGPGAPVPFFTIDTRGAEDKKEQRAGVELLLKHRQPVTRRHFYLAAGAPIPRAGEDVVEAQEEKPTLPTPPPVPPPAEPAASSDQDPKAAAAARRTIALAASDDTREAERRASDIDDVIKAFRPAYLEHGAEFTQLAAAAFDESKTADEVVRAIVSRLDPRPLVDRLAAAGTHGAGLAYAHLLDAGLDETTLRLPSPATDRVVPVRSPSGSSFAELAVGFDIAAANTPASAISMWLRSLNLPPEAFAGFEEAISEFALYVAGVTDTRALVEVHRLTQRAIAEGWSREKFRNEMAQALERVGLDARSDAHADLVLTQAVSTANGAIFYQQTVGNPAAHRLLPYLRILTLDDPRVRARRAHNHSIVHGLTFAIQHVIWHTWWIPFGFNCRCQIVTINSARAKREGLIGAEPTGPWPLDPFGDGDAQGRALPDPGFRGVTTIATASEDTLERLHRIIDAAETESTALAAALRDFVRRLGVVL